MDADDQRSLVSSDLQPFHAPLASWTPRRRGTLGICLATALLLLFCDWTDYSLPGTLADVALPLVSLAAGIVALQISRDIRTRAAKIAAKLVAVVTVVEASATILAVAILAFVSPLGIMLVAVSIPGEEQTGSVVSPDEMRVADIHYQGGGLLSEGLGFVRVKHRLMPLLERDVYRGFPIPPDGVTWQDNDTLFLSETRTALDVGTIQFELPPPAQIGIVTWQLFDLLWGPNSYIAEMHRRDEEMSRPLKDIPIFPGGTENDNSGANIGEESGYRAFDIKVSDSDDAAKWYKVALSQEPWTVVSTKRWVTVGTTLASESEERLVYNCIEAIRRETDGTSRRFYWRLLGREHGRTVRVIVETPEPPAWSACDGT